MTSNNTNRKARNFAARELRDAERAEAEPVIGGAADWAGTGTTSRRYYADGLTERGRPGQCEGCGTWRPDGQPPTVHRYKCVYGPDGEQYGAIYDPAPIERLKQKTVKKPLTPGHPPRVRR